MKFRLVPGLLDGFSIGRYERKSESFGISAASFESGATRFSRGKSPGAGAGQKIDFTTLVFLLRGTVNSELKILQNGSKYHY